MNLDMLPKDRIYEYIFGEPLPSASGATIKDHVLAKAGFSKDSLLKSVYLVILMILILALLTALVVMVVKKCFEGLPENVKNVLLSVQHKLMFNSILRATLQIYLPLSISCFVSLKYSESTGDKVSSIILLVFLSLFQFAVMFILNRQTHPLYHPFYLVRMGTLYLNVDTVGKPFALLFTSLFLIRRLLFAFCVVMIENVLVQLFVTMYASLVLILFYAVVWPMNDTVNNVLQLGNEIFFIVCVHFMLVFTDYSTDPVKRNTIGYAYLFFLAVNIIVNVALIAYTVVKKLQEAYRNRNKEPTKVQHKKGTIGHRLQLEKRKKKKI